MLALATAASIFVPLVLLSAADTGLLSRSFRFLILGSLSTVHAIVTEWQISDIAKLVLPEIATNRLFLAFIVYALVEEAVRLLTQNVVIIYNFG
jgi:hypothetical protein